MSYQRHSITRKFNFNCLLWPGGIQQVCLLKASRAAEVLSGNDRSFHYGLSDILIRPSNYLASGCPSYDLATWDTFTAEDDPFL
jgi:hypothetical protein